MRGDQRLMRAPYQRAAPAQSPLNSENAPALNAGFAAEPSASSSTCVRAARRLASFA